MSSETTTAVRMFGALQTHRKEQGLASETEVNIPTGGCVARVLACELDLPLDKVEAVFVNHQIYSLDHCIEPGDLVTFIPTGTRGAARDLLVSYDSGHCKNESN